MNRILRLHMYTHRPVTCTDDNPPPVARIWPPLNTSCRLVFVKAPLVVLRLGLLAQLHGGSQPAGA